MRLFGVYGASGCGRGVMPFARDQAEAEGVQSEVVFIDDSLAGTRSNGHRVISYADFLGVDADERFAAIAIANSAARERIWRQCEADGVCSWDVRASNIVIFDNVEIAPGSIICPFVTLTANIRIGQQFHANIYSYVEHDCVIGDFVTFAPGVKCNGNVLIEDHAYIGSGAILRQGQLGKPLQIGRGAVIGMGAVVTKDVPAGATVVGNPARLLTRN